MTRMEMMMMMMIVIKCVTLARFVVIIVECMNEIRERSQDLRTSCAEAIREQKTYLERAGRFEERNECDRLSLV